MDQVASEDEEVMKWKEIYFQCHFLRTKKKDIFKDIEAQSCKVHNNFHLKKQTGKIDFFFLAYRKSTKNKQGMRS